jgi:hypothetical protein
MPASKYVSFCVRSLTASCVQPVNTLGFFILNFRRVVNVVCFLLGNSPASEFCMPTFRNTLFHLHRQVGMKNKEEEE